MTDAPSATARPWFISRDPRPGMHWNNHIASVADPNQEVCAMFHDDTEENALGEANAALIVTAVNERETLLKRIAELEAALRDIASDADTWRSEAVNAYGHDCLIALRDRARSTLQPEGASRLRDRGE